MTTYKNMLRSEVIIINIFIGQDLPDALYQYWHVCDSGRDFSK
jgi:hypothetical protein